MLPKVSHSKFRLKLSGKNVEIELRPFLVKEEKLLLMAMESRKDSEIVDTVIQIIQNCILTENINVKELPSFDVENIFLQLRIKSVGETVELMLRHQDKTNLCPNVQKVVVDLEQVKLVENKDHKKVIMISDDIGITMKYPTMSKVNSMGSADIKSLFALVTDCIENIFQGDDVYSTFTDKEITEWLEGLSEEQFQKIMAFFNTMPYLYHEVEYTCPKCNTKETYKMRGLKDFFI